MSQAPREGPFPKPLSIIHEHYVQPITHLTYAITWYDLNNHISYSNIDMVFIYLFPFGFVRFSLTAFGTIMTYKKFKPRGIRR